MSDILPPPHDTAAMAIFLMAHPTWSPVLDSEGKCIGVEHWVTVKLRNDKEDGA